MKKIKKIEEFIKNIEIGLDITDDRKSIINISKYEKLNEYNKYFLKNSAENMGLDLTKNLSKRIDII